MASVYNLRFPKLMTFVIVVSMAPYGWADDSQDGGQRYLVEEEIETFRGIEFVGCSDEAKLNLADSVDFMKSNMTTLKNDTNLHRREGRERSVRRRMDRKVNKIKFDCRTAVLCRDGDIRDGMHAFGIMTNRLRICYREIKDEGFRFCPLTGLVAHEFGHAVGIAKDRVGQHHRDKKDRVYQFGWFARDRCYYLSQDRSLSDPPKGPTEPAPPQTGITLFPHVDYQGWGRNYFSDVSNLRVQGRQDTTSSIQVRSGTWVVCKDSSYDGDCEIVDQDIPNTHAIGFGDNISSIALLEAPSPGIQFFEHAGFGGDAEELQPGESISDLSEIDFEDKISSVRVGNNERWEICADDDFNGPCALITADNPNLKSIGFNDRTSSIRQYRRRPPTTGAVLFKDKQYRGAELELDYFTADGALTDPEAISLMSNRVPDMADRSFNDIASSVRVMRGVWQFCEDKLWRGNCIVVEKDTEDLGPRQMNDKISSAELLFEFPGEIKLFVYEDVAGLGDKLEITTSIPDLSGTGLNDKISSLGILGGWWQTCTDKNYKGKCKTWQISVRDLSDFGYNDKISSIRLIPFPP